MYSEPKAAFVDKNNEIPGLNIVHSSVYVT